MVKRYFTKLDAEISPLGFGLMRLPMNADNWFDAGVFELIDRSIELGVNYYDTGYYYQNERSEELIREALVKRHRDRNYYIADKLPVWDCKSREDMERIFEEQLKRLGVDTIDFYLLHALHRGRWNKLYEAGVLDFLDDKKKEGRIIRAGFSFHDSAAIIKEILPCYNWDFVQLQLNYYDWTVLHIDDIYELLEKSGIPCITMETVGGGRLSILPEDAKRVFSDLHNDWTPSAWAMRFAVSLDNVAVVLSGMNAIGQLEDNVQNCSKIDGLTKEEINAINKVVEILHSKGAVPCTACRYCVKECPKKIDIPQVLKAINDYRIFEKPEYFDISYNLLSGATRAEDCVACGKCKEQCPQKIDIPFQMTEIRKFALEREIGINNHLIEDIQRKNKTIICFGCGEYGKRAIKYLKDYKIDRILLCDNKEDLWGKNINGYRVISPDRAVEMIKNEEAKMIITTRKFFDVIKKQFTEEGMTEADIMNY